MLKRLFFLKTLKKALKMPFLSFKRFCSNLQEKKLKSFKRVQIVFLHSAFFSLSRVKKAHRAYVIGCTLQTILAGAIPIELALISIWVFIVIRASTVVHLTLMTILRLLLLPVELILNRVVVVSLGRRVGLHLELLELFMTKSILLRVLLHRGPL